MANKVLIAGGLCVAAFGMALFKTGLEDVYPVYRSYQEAQASAPPEQVVHLDACLKRASEEIPSDWNGYRLAETMRGCAANSADPEHLPAGTDMLVRPLALELVQK